MPKPLFGGNGATALPWTPLPYMHEYLENLHADNRDAQYIASVQTALKHFARFAVEHDPPIRHPDEIERSHVLRFQTYVNGLTSTWPSRQGQPLAEQYRQQIMKYIRAWVAWMVELEHITTNPWLRIKIGRVKKTSKTLETEELTLLFDTHVKQAFSLPAFQYHRREVILVLLFGWGLRRHELTSLTVTSMGLDQGYVTVRNKHTSSGMDEKVLPYPDLMKQVVARWLTQRARYADRSVDALLINQEGRPLSTDMVYKIITRLGERAGISINPHRLRDTFGTTLLDSDAPVERIQAMMGHSRREQTLAYARLNDHRLTATHDQVMVPVLKGLLHQ